MQDIDDHLTMMLLGGHLGILERTSRVLGRITILETDLLHGHQGIRPHMAHTPIA